MAISTRISRSPVTPSAQSPSIGARPSSSRPSSVKNSMAASMSATTMPTLSIRLTVMRSPWRLTTRASAARERRAGEPETYRMVAEVDHHNQDAPSRVRCMRLLGAGQRTSVRPGNLVSKHLLANRRARAAMLAVDAPHVIAAWVALPAFQPVLPAGGPRLGHGDRILRRQTGGHEDCGGRQVSDAEAIADQIAGPRRVVRDEIQRLLGQRAACLGTGRTDLHVER